MPGPYSEALLFRMSKASSVDNSVLQISLQFQVDPLKIVRVLLLDVLKNTVFRKTSVRV